MSSFFLPLLTSSISEAEVGEPPDVAQADGVAHHGEEEVQLAAPLLPLRDIIPGPGLHGREVAPLGVLKYMLELKRDEKMSFF